ncbi:VWA domain-containing protein [Arthrobacter sp. CDRTa11]|uniref:VWA domain-containing protein n=1 Tax=Arthrobacter sp. CDRTa11 TaxID=2651199 RepID=UPI002265D12E|nr:VWA domain-containing protein [Arthrobacter sp. CDRTa11]UZX01546.1 VWA domain-containing protein [Arthrobacter sp. CDRTa11]
MSARRAALRARHSASPRPSRFPWARIAIVFGTIVALAVAGGAVVWIMGMRTPAEASHCTDPVDVTVGADAAMAPVLEQAASRIPPEACVNFTFATLSQAELAAKVSAGKDAPDVWVADSAVRVQRVVTTTPPEVIVPSLASTPGVIVGRAGEVAAFATWLSALQAPGVRFGDPLVTGSGEVALLGAVSEVQAGLTDAKALQAATAQLAQKESQRAGEKLSDVQQLESVATSGGFVIVTEEAWLKFSKTTSGALLAASVPASGAVSLNYPLVSTAGSGTRGQAVAAAARALAEQVATDEGRTNLAGQGLRPADSSNLLDQKGAGPVVALAPASAQAVSQALSAWSVQAIPFRSLVVMDVSGSMEFPAGNQTRMELTQQAATTGSKLFPNTAALGLWAFSIGLGGGSQDYLELEPIRKMDQVVDGVTQRDRLVAGIAGLSERTGGATGLYDSTLAAFRTVQASYDSRAINSVILFTDGANEDPESLTLEQLLETLQRERDPAKPVVIVTIGITEDADAETLTKISAATGGTSYVARAPQDIPSVFADALLARGK